MLTNTSLPKLSICIPSYDRQQRVVALLESIALACTFVSSELLEVIVLLDGSRDESERKIQALSRNYPCLLRCSWQKNKGLAATRNALTVEARGDIIWFLDDDMLITKEALEIHLHYDRSLSPILMGPSLVEGNEAMRKYYDERWTRLSQTRRVKHPWDASFANTSAPRSLFIKYIFNEAFKRYGFEDYELAIRLIEADIIINFDPGAIVTHKYERGPFKLLQNIRDEGINRVKLFDLFPDQGAFALKFKYTKTKWLLATLSNFGFSRILWVCANLVRLIALLAQGGCDRYNPPWIRKAVGIANGMALHSGIAEAGGKVKIVRVRTLRKGTE